VYAPLEEATPKSNDVDQFSTSPERWAEILVKTSKINVNIKYFIFKNIKDEDKYINYYFANNILHSYLF
jgi:hypothetical protein